MKNRKTIISALLVFSFIIILACSVEFTNDQDLPSEATISALQTEINQSQVIATETSTNKQDNAGIPAAEVTVSALQTQVALQEIEIEYQQTIEAINATANALELTAKSPTKTSAPPPPQSTSPVIETVKLRYQGSSGSRIIYQDFYFYDLDGNSNYIAYNLIDVTPNKSINIKNGAINVPYSEQTSMGVATGKWTCNGKYNITLRATIYDEDGNQSNSVTYTMKCN